jgi:deoxyribodipyrimidine photo-lyase
MNMSSPTVIHWFRQDLRLSDNPALTAAAGGNVLPVYILDDVNAKEQRMGAASRAWLHRSLESLNHDLNGKLALYAGDAFAVIDKLVKEYPTIRTIHWNRCYEPWRIARDAFIKERMKDKGIEVVSHNGALLWEPWEVLKSDGTPYRVFTPFYRRGCLGAPPPRTPLPIPPTLECATLPHDTLQLSALELLPHAPRWDISMLSDWKVGEKAAQSRLSSFLEAGLKGYKEGRNFPSLPHISRLSPHLHYGEVSPNQVWTAVTQYAAQQAVDKDADHFLSELGWREFSTHLLYHTPTLPTDNLQPRFDAFPWQTNGEALERWKRGQTGYPIVDAGMRELWKTGFMHNRLRMIVASFLVKNLLIDWRHGEHWFWDCLVDADLANNAASWQWVAGCGADAAPYFRIFNPIGQGEKFDAAGNYTRHYVKELRDMPDKYLFRPWEAPPEILRGAGVRLGKDYPHPIIDVKASREKALAAFATLKSFSASAL